MIKITYTCPINDRKVKHEKCVFNRQTNIMFILHNFSFCSKIITSSPKNICASSASIWLSMIQRSTHYPFDVRLSAHLGVPEIIRKVQSKCYVYFLRLRSELRKNSKISSKQKIRSRTGDSRPPSKMHCWDRIIARRILQYVFS